MNAVTAGHAGTPQLKQFHTGNIDMWKHPKYYKELRKRNNSDQAISLIKPDGENESVRPGPGLKLPGPRPISNANKGLIHKQQASGNKQQAPSNKRSLE